MPSAISLDDEIIVAIRRISQAVEGYSRYLWQEYGLTAPQLGALRELEKSPLATPGHIAEKLHVSPQTVAGILKRLEQRGLITRARVENDRRSFSLQLSEEGRRLSNEAPSLLRDQFRTELTRLQVWEATQILSTLQRVATMMSAEDVTDSAPYFTPSLEISNGEADDVASVGTNTANGKTKHATKSSLRA
ncbi:Organic hydroperoxide resistance transcriptional regulator [Anatilimnocola aggregata]|uniref:Organic hydroperoxide resistance transcriptional regulator n=1 Tax=Anatilimnocola aggregata TaxID=2528021 RepID=A0A517YGL0_9BACT|nr:MarR family transcriptional regulator [Anatilimnocola aggregata]QDU29357.1 Organic hydroperoxide resistance transcriptional regulator [Anatilimnocola aggregata]